MIEHVSHSDARKLKAILFADVAGYTRLMHENEVDTHTDIKNLLAIFTKGCKELNGEILEVRGDGVFFLFSSVVNAVTFASTTQDTIQEYNQKHADERKVRFRIGIHCGDVIRDEDVHYGDSINIAARIEGLATPGGICISSPVYHQVKNSLQLGYENMGLQQLKNIKEPVEVFSVTKELTAATRAASPRSPLIAIPSTTESDDLAVRPSIVVLPLKNASNSADFEYFSDGITEDIISGLSRFHSLFVIARGSAFSYKYKELPARQIGRELGVRYLADGSIRSSGNRVRISIQLVDTDKDQILWTEQYDRVLDDIFELQDEISAIIANAISAKIDREENVRLKRLLPNDLEAYDNVLKGQHRIIGYTKQDIQAARDLYQLAANLDPRYARALASIARTINYEWLFSWNDPTQDTLAEALAFANDAVKLDEGDARAHAGIGFVSLYQKRHDASINAYKRALALNPNDADILSDLADTYTHSGRHEEAIELIKKAMRLNPHYPDEYLWNIGGAYYSLQQYSKAIEAVEQMNNPTEGSRILAASYAQLGQTKQAQQQAKNILAAHPEFSLESWASVMPDKIPEETMHFVEGLRKAGLH